VNIKISEVFKAAKKGFEKHFQPSGIDFSQFLPLVEVCQSLPRIKPNLNKYIAAGDVQKRPLFIRRGCNPC
jgi:hypothetical protein